MAPSDPLEKALITHGEMRRTPEGGSVYDQDDVRWVKHGPWWHQNDGGKRLLGTELKRLSQYLYVLRPFRAEAYLSGRGFPRE